MLSSQKIFTFFPPQFVKVSSYDWCNQFHTDQFQYIISIVMKFFCTVRVIDNWYAKNGTFCSLPDQKKRLDIEM